VKRGGGEEESVARRLAPLEAEAGEAGEGWGSRYGATWRSKCGRESGGGVR
jgi:hypothetical protein